MWLSYRFCRLDMIMRDIHISEGNDMVDIKFRVRNIISVSLTNELFCEVTVFSASSWYYYEVF